MKASQVMEEACDAAAAKGAWWAQVTALKPRACHLTVASQGRLSSPAPSGCCDYACETVGSYFNRGCKEECGWSVPMPVLKEILGTNI